LVAISSCLLGLVIGIVAQIIHVRSFEKAQAKVTEGFESRGESPPLLIDMQKPSFYPMLFSAGFGVAGTFLCLIYYVLVSRSHET
jgi:hypothetical protein